MVTLLKTPATWPRILLARSAEKDPTDLDAAVAAGAFDGLRRAIRDLGGAATIATIAASGLRGRGGAGYPTGDKWRTAADTDADRRYVVANQDLIGAGAKDGAKDRFDAGQPPAFGELLVDQRVDTKLLAHHALHEVAEEGGLRFGVLAALDLPPQAMRLEFGDHGVEVDPGHVHLIQGLDRGEPGGTAG